jgi:hypothetical protein
VCWGRFPDVAGPLPYLVLISNFHNRVTGNSATRPTRSLSSLRAPIRASRPSIGPESG